MPIVHSGQGSNSSPSTGNAAVNVQVNVQIGVIASKRKVRALLFGSPI